MTTTAQDFVERYTITAEVEHADSNPNMEDMVKGTRHYLVTLRHEPTDAPPMRVHFSMGPALNDEPDAAEVLACLAMDAAGIENTDSFEDWAAEYGYDTDSRRAERSYLAAKRQTEELRALLGDELFDELVWDTERM